MSRTAADSGRRREVVDVYVADPDVDAFRGLMAALPRDLRDRIDNELRLRNGADGLGPFVPWLETW